MGLLDKLFGSAKEVEEAIMTLFPYTESEKTEREKWEEAREQIEAERKAFEAERKKGR